MCEPFALRPLRPVEDMSRQETLRNDFEYKIMSEISDVTVNSVHAKRLPNTSSVHIAGAPANEVIENAPQIEITVGSKFSLEGIKPSHVLTAMGLSREAADESIRVSIGKQTTKSDIDIAVDALSKAVKFIRNKEVKIRNE